MTRDLSTTRAAARRAWARWGLLATTLAMAVALIVGSWLNYRGVVAAVNTLNRGQADLLEAALREVTHPGGRRVDDATLAAFLESHGAAGLRFVGVMDAGGDVVYRAGAPARPLADGLEPGDRAARSTFLMSVDGLVRAYFPRPPLPADSSDRPAPSREGEPGGPRRPAGLNVIEFEPVASGLVARAERTLALAGIGAAILTLAALLFWRTAERYEQARVQLEQQRRLSLLGEMSAVLAHEIRNPLASLKGHAQLLVERLPADTPDRRKAERVVDEATRLEALTSDLLDFARSGPMDLRPTDPLALLRSAAAELGEAAIEVDGTGAPDRWPLDERRFRQAVLLNLLRNAVQEAPAGRPPQARATLENGHLVFTIRDFGPGLPDGDRARLFDPFFTTRTTGTGLGLPVARRIVELHGGRIVAEDAPGGGALFRVELPRRDG